MLMAESMEWHSVLVDVGWPGSEHQRKLAVQLLVNNGFTKLEQLRHALKAKDEQLKAKDSELANASRKRDDEQQPPRKAPRVAC